LAEAGGAWCLEQKDLTPEVLADGLAGLFSAPHKLAEAAAAAKAQGRPAAVTDLADLVEELIGLGRRSA
jgi:UDP-N-acetylglucosamine--N-acetylmuramyl-(pentapeptide) pyrophosphoryl-undecaprenol N-acetylglucosamine transferase